MKTNLLFSLLLIGFGAFSANPLISQEQSEKGKEKLKLQEICPVMGGKVNKKLFVDKDGKRIYVCCGGCLEPVKKNFSKFEKKLNAKGEKPHPAPVEKGDLKLQETCPVMGSKINKNLFIDKDGKRIYVCCGGCLAPVKKDFSKFEKKLATKGEKPHPVPEKK